MDLETRNTLARIGDAFGLPGEPLEWTEIKQGNVNTTYRGTYQCRGEKRDYLFQRVNTYVFRHPEELMENIDRVTSHIQAGCPGQACLRYLENPAGKNYLSDDTGFWRVCAFIPSVTFDTGKDLRVVRSAGEAFGGFQASLRDFDAARLHETIPDFHNTRKRYAALREAAEKDPAGRKKDVPGELAWLLSVEDTACRLTDLAAVGKLPLRVTHNDTKINNVLFSPDTCQALTVIDLDTVMPGLVGFDFGDAIRSAANQVEEDHEDASLARLNMPVFRAFSEGFLSKTARTLTREEIGTLPISCVAMTVEVAVRFLTDYLNGDVYFRVARPDHNLIRTRNQIALAQDMLKKTDEMAGIVEACRAMFG
ncbi:MAG: aminoglycoside phosphotransferase family protein [Clostridia bacterium]|nr:aminoglycoside phosphotransferase family protein [Clostridia bacterium]